ncbi:hypothetical protein TNCV_3736681 [Trichonephila clavipes]|nr:hypothetical protein TNCV_3736681 [Trichonephila clavipes]
MRAKTYCGHLSMTLDAEVHVQMLRSGGPSGAKPTVVHLVPKQVWYRDRNLRSINRGIDFSAKKIDM